MSGRTDIDVIAYWTLQNLGVGNVALIKAARARLGATQFQQIAVLNRVRAEVAMAYARTHARFAQIGTTEAAVRASQRGFREDYDLTIQQTGRKVLPIELLNNFRLLNRVPSRIPRRDRRLQPGPVRALRRAGPAAGRLPWPARSRSKAWPLRDCREPARSRRRRGSIPPRREPSLGPPTTPDADPSPARSFVEPGTTERGPGDESEIPRRSPTTGRLDRPDARGPVRAARPDPAPSGPPGRRRAPTC